MKRREMSCSRAPRVFAGRRLSLLLFCRLASPLLPQCPSFTRSEIGETGAAGQRSRRICDACRVTVLLWVEDWDEGARGERERANRSEGEDCGSAVVRLTLWKGVECSADTGSPPSVHVPTQCTVFPHQNLPKYTFLYYL